MDSWNQSYVTEFILLGLTDNPKLQIILFVLFLLFYIITVLGNIGIIIVTRLDPRLQTPMYFFLNNLSFLDLCYATVISPQALANFLSKRKVISRLGCGVQMFFFAGSVTTECFFLGVMAYDRYVAICNPLLYTVIMNRRVCIQLISGAYAGGYLNSLIHTICTFRLPFCESNQINHFFCDVPPLLKLSCADTHMNEVMMFILGGFAEMSSLTIILVSYTYIISAILKIRSSEGRYKAFSTCGSHLICVTLFYGTIIFMYLRPRSSYVMDQDRVASVFYAVVIPMLNPLIYSLRNKEVTNALKKAVHKNMISQ
ncbi:olfactory receptor 1019-like isoform X1 [Rhinatrema bivittatum]|uniref:olfactory receptor 1019-like isoform X1 n=1 Tax=Rhinatrema bivittatum TaxID=194408 RepID=UPI00112835B5|nr:olfactory receptor 1019-like isoform X1 [Rhinatrema bivittatum]